MSQTEDKKPADGNENKTERKTYMQRAIEMVYKHSNQTKDTDKKK